MFVWSKAHVTRDSSSSCYFNTFWQMMEIKQAKVCQMGQIKCESSTTFKGNIHAFVRVCCSPGWLCGFNCPSFGSFDLLSCTVHFVLPFVYNFHLTEAWYLILPLKAVVPELHFNLSSLAYFCLFNFRHPPYWKSRKMILCGMSFTLSWPFHNYIVWPWPWSSMPPAEHNSKIEHLNYFQLNQILFWQ